MFVPGTGPAEEGEGHEVCEEGQGQDKEEDACNGKPSGAWWVCWFMERMIFWQLPSLLMNENQMYFIASSVCWIN